MTRMGAMRPSGTVVVLALLVTLVTLVFLLASGRPVAAQGSADGGIPGVSIDVSMTSISLREADYFTFNTRISNNGTEATPALVAHLNVVALQSGTYVDPEDWAGERTEFLGTIAPGASKDLTWRVHGLFAGEFAIYVAVLVQDSSSSPVVSDEVHVHIESWTVMQLSGVMPVVVAVPVVLGALYAWQRSHLVLRRREREGRTRPAEE